MNLYRKLFAISIQLLFLLIQSSLQECYEKLYRTKENSSCKIWNPRYSRTCIEHYKQNFYELHCYMITDSIQNQYSKDVYNIKIQTSNLKMGSEFFHNFTNTESITIENSNITSIDPDVFTNLTNLNTLNITRNNIDVLYKKPFTTNGKLKLLDLSKNNISVVEDDLLEELVHLETLLLSGNIISDASPLLNNCGNLSKLVLPYNNIEQIEFTPECSQLKTLILHNNNIKVFSAKIDEESELEYLNLASNNIDYVDGDSFKYFVGLKELDLSQNPLFKINDLPVNLFQNKLQLVHLNLSQTGIQYIVTGTFTKLSDLQILDLSHNELTDLPKGIFHDLTLIKIIYLKNNYLTQFDCDDYTHEQSTIDLNYNWWDCDTLADMVRILNKKVVSLQPGSVHNTSNVRGIGCFENEQQTNQRYNLDEENSLDLKELQRGLHQILIQQESILNKSLLESVQNDLKQMRLAEVAPNTREVSNTDRNYKPMVVGIYLILIILIAGLCLLLLMAIKKGKIVEKPQEELRTLNTFEV